MFCNIHKLSRLQTLIPLVSNNLSRTFLSQAYYCQEVWDMRLNSPLLQKVNLEELYQELDQGFQKTRQISAVDVNIFANALKSNVYIDELLDLIHKLRLSADTGNTLNSTSHAVIRVLMQYGSKNDLLAVLDDRINYGVFVDYYTANILMDTFWKAKDFTSGARVASQLMLQEEFEHPLCSNLSLLHCYNYLLTRGEWPIPLLPEEPEEEVKIRVKYLRNPFNDDHFNLKDPQKIVGKTLAMLTKKSKDSLNKSFNILGWVLYNKLEKAQNSLKESHELKIPLFKEILDLIPESSEVKQQLTGLNYESKDIQQILKENVEQSVHITSERDIAEQCKLFILWEEERIKALEEHKQRLLVAKRLAHIEELRKTLEEKETRLWFFDHQEQIELQIEGKQEEEHAKAKEVKKTKDISEENYIPPEVRAKQSS